jgi:hypothetical protein
VGIAADVVQRQSYSDGDEETRTVIADTGNELKQTQDSPRSPGDSRRPVSVLYHRTNVSVTTASHLEHPHALDPEDYGHAKKKLKKAVLEHYR